LTSCRVAKALLLSGKGRAQVPQHRWIGRAGAVARNRVVYFYSYTYSAMLGSRRVFRDWLSQRTWKDDQLFTIPTCNYERALVSNSIGSAESSVSPPYQRQQTILVLTIHLNASRGDRPRAVSKTVARKPASNSEGIPIPIAHTKCPTRQVCSGYGRRRQRGGG
jgi:hypothetical protein